jgi:hypothetical protein
MCQINDEYYLTHVMQNNRYSCQMFTLLEANSAHPVSYNPLCRGQIFGELMRGRVSEWLPGCGGRLLPCGCGYNWTAGYWPREPRTVATVSHVTLLHTICTNKEQKQG